jgi:integrase
MAIQIYCLSKLPDGKPCKTSNALAAKTCSRCGTAFTKDNRKYRVCVSQKGQRVNRIVDNLTIAREVEKTIGADLLRGEFDISHHKVQRVITLAKVWEQYLPWAKEHKRSWDDDDYHYRKHLAPRFGTKALQDITSFDIEKMKSELKKGLNAHGKPYAAATIKHQIVLLRRLFNVARKWGLFEGENPVGRVQMPKVDNQKTEFLTAEELGRLLETLDKWPCADTVAFIRFALFTGLRRGELFKLTWDDIDFERSLITLREPKGGRTTTIPVNPQAVDVLRSLDVTSLYVFPGKDGKQRTDFKGPWERVRKAAGLPGDFRFHGLRHHYASTLVSNGVDLGIVRELLTHKHVGTTERYAHFAPDAIRAAALRAGELLNRKPVTRTIRSTGKGVDHA